MTNFKFLQSDIIVTISRHCPRAFSTFIHIANRVNENGQFFFSRPLVEIDMSMSWTRFRNDVKLLAQEDLLEWHPVDNGIAIQLSLDLFDPVDDDLEEEDD